MPLEVTVFQDSKTLLKVNYFAIPPKIMKLGALKLRFREADRNIFNAIRSGKKKVETRAATERYRKVKTGDILIFVCGKSSFKKKVQCVEIFKSISSLLRKYKPEQINPFVSSEKELRQMYKNFYGDKIKKIGLVAWRLK